MYITIPNNIRTAVMRWQQDDVMVGGHYRGVTVLKDCSVRKVQNHCPRILSKRTCQGEWGRFSDCMSSYVTTVTPAALHWAWEQSYQCRTESRKSPLLTYDLVQIRQEKAVYRLQISTHMKCTLLPSTTEKPGSPSTKHKRKKMQLLLF